MALNLFPKIGRAESAFLLRLLSASPVEVPASKLGDDADMVPDLETAGLVIVLTEDDTHPEPRVVLALWLALKMGYERIEKTNSWEMRWKHLTKGQRQHRARVISETDLIANARKMGEKVRAPVQEAIDAASPPMNHGGWDRPILLLGESRTWDGPDVGNIAKRPNRACPICAGEMPERSACLKCDRFAQEKPRKVRLKRLGKAAAG